MARTLSGENQTGIVQSTTRELWLMEIGFSTPLRLSSRGTVTYNSNSYVGVSGLDVTLALDALSGVVRFRDTDQTYSQIAYSEGLVGQSVQLGVYYGEDAALGLADLDVMFVGETGGGSVRAGQLQIDLQQAQDIYTPRNYITAADFSHLPPDGTKIETTNGVIVLSTRS